MSESRLAPRRPRSQQRMHVGQVDAFADVKQEQAPNATAQRQLSIHKQSSRSPGYRLCALHLLRVRIARGGVCSSVPVGPDFFGLARELTITGWDLAVSSVSR